MAIAVAAGVSFAASAQEGPRPSSYDNWPGMAHYVTPAATPYAGPIEPPASGAGPDDPVSAQPLTQQTLRSMGRARPSAH
jgi:hypothetical protein